MSSSPLDPRFIEAVRQGKIEGVEFSDFVENLITTPDGGFFSDAPLGQGEIDHLCAQIRRWLTSRDVRWSLGRSGLILNPGGFVCGRNQSKVFKEGTELDWHVQLALNELAKEETNA